MNLDIRLPIGGLFSLLGILLSIYGVATGSDRELYQVSLGLNINLIWGAVLLLFGFPILVCALRQRPRK